MEGIETGDGKTSLISTIEPVKDDEGTKKGSLEINMRNVKEIVNTLIRNGRGKRLGLSSLLLL